MNGASSFQEVRSTSQSPSYRFLPVQRQQFGAGSRHLLSASATRTIGILGVMQVWLLCFGPEIFAQTVSLEGLEVTQSIQVMSFSNPQINNSVPLIANKKTVVRAYFSTLGGGTITLTRGELNATSNPCPVGMNCNIPSVNLAPVTVSNGENGNLQVKRDTIVKSLNFELPPDWVRPGTLTLTLEQITGPGGTPITCRNCAGSFAMVTFRSSPSLRLRLIGLRYARGETPTAPRDNDFALIKSWLKRAYPVAGIMQPFEDYTYDYDTSLGDLFQDWDGNGKPDPDACSYPLAQVLAIRNSEVGPDFFGHFKNRYYGLISDGTPDTPKWIMGCSDMNTTGVGPVGPVVPGEWGWDTDGSYGDWYAAHELGHTFGRLHLKAGCAGDATDYLDLSADGHVSPNPPSEPYYVGLDSGDNLHFLPITPVPGSGYDVMTYCHPIKWIGNYTYEGIREQLLWELMLSVLPFESSNFLKSKKEILDPIGSLPEIESESEQLKRCLKHADDPIKFFHCRQKLFFVSEEPGIKIFQGEFLNVLAVVNFKKSTGRIYQADRFKYIVAKHRTPDKRIHIRVTGRDKKVITYPVEVIGNINIPLDKRAIGLINTPILLTNNMATIELVMDGKRIGEPIIVTNNSPRVDEITLPVIKTREEFFKTPVVLTFRVSDEDSKTLTSTVQFSSDTGRTWQTLGIGLSKPELKIDPKLFKDLTDVRIKVIASDGFNKGEKIVPLDIPTK
jgi:hypothetical protein